MEPGAASSKIYRFGLFETDVAKGTLTRNGIRVKLQDQPFRVLILLLERPGEIISRDELRQKVWPEGTYVDFDGSLNVILKKLRAAIDDDSDNPRFIETVPRRGYRFIAPVSAIGPKSASDPTPTKVVSDDSRVVSQVLRNAQPQVDSSGELPFARQSRRLSAPSRGLIFAAAALILIPIGAGWIFFH